MRAPISLEDRSLLGEEPFASFFSARHSGRKKQAVRSFLEKVSTLVETAPGGVQAVETWLSLAFDSIDSGKPRQHGLRHRHKQPSAKTFTSFVKFYWYLFSGQDAMRLLGTLKLEGYTVKHPAQKDPFDEPMSPLTVMSDDGTPPPFINLDTAPFFIKRESSPVPGIEERALSEPNLESPQITSLVHSTIPVALHLSEDAPVAALAHTNSAPDPLIVLSPVISVAESFPTPHTPARARLTPRPAPTVKQRRGRPRKLPVTDDTSAVLPPRGLLTAPSTSGIQMTYPLEHPVEHTASTTEIGGDWSFFGSFSPFHPPTLPPVPAGIEIKLDPSEGEPESLRLLDPSDAPANWLTLPVNETSLNESDELLLVTEPQHPPKPPLPRLPPLWAQSRQEVCESFEWFRSYQGGVYQNDGTVKGYFLSAFSADRDVFACGGKIIISHGGGKSASSRTQNGQTTNKAADDQRAHDISVRALIETYRKNQPLVLLIDDKYRLFPFDLGSRDVYMAILGFYKIVHLWAEYQPSASNSNGRVVRYKFAFQWCEDQGEPWWSKQHLDAGDVPMPDNVETTVIGPMETVLSPLKPDHLYSACKICSEKSPRVYQQEWACLNPTCPSFWIALSGRALPDQLEYNPEFLAVIDFRPLPHAFRDSLLPKPPVLAPKDGITTTYTHSRGWHCRECGRLSCRSAWEHYQCPNCNDTHAIVGTVRPAKTLMSIRVPISDKFVDSLIDPWSGIQRVETKIFNHSDVPGATGRYQTFILPEKKGKIHLIQTNRLANVEADRIFEAYQQQASDGTLLFRRWPLRNHKLRGPLLTNYFSQNSGETYHYVGGTDNTVPFDRAPGAVIQARNLIQKRIAEALGVEHLFNEVLSAAYMEQQKMAFHSDSERGLGPVVAGLSMGSPALMHFRLLSKYTPRSEQRSNAMTVVLRHGDVLVMEGAGVQDYYEHTVVPCNFRIAATARWIAPNHT
ncbi:hypothetical protein B0H17DRAFT_1051168 [Mycena rosella]|uniref:Alpha-ketoglutarate-dependent dioxygenase AlkB-like domain-containing protein n=1 Tax=Mycena rosella TaxID=1033263 RepID=A0AAD7DUJ1_MYCRO|nr:hypothetical protein B0H17DRAFT_1051168 [Mycena rosella]